MRFVDNILLKCYRLSKISRVTGEIAGANPAYQESP